MNAANPEVELRIVEVRFQRPAAESHKIKWYVVLQGPMEHGPLVKCRDSKL
jgi:nitrogen fixation protein FixH